MRATGRLAQILDDLDEPTRAALTAHLEANTSAEWLSIVLTEAGHPISASSIRTQRRTWAAESGTTHD